MINASLSAATYKAIELLCTMTLAAIVIGGVLGTLVAARMLNADQGKSRSEYGRKAIAAVLYSSAFAFLGVVAGVLTGNSRSGAVGDLVPAVLTLFGALSVALLGTNTLYRDLMVACALALTTATFLGTMWGTYMRDVSQNSQQALIARANLVARCRLQEIRAQQIVELSEAASAANIDMKCADYPR